jgi:hypothetical protein
MVENYHILRAAQKRVDLSLRLGLF